MDTIFLPIVLDLSKLKEQAIDIVITHRVTNKKPNLLNTVMPLRLAYLKINTALTADKATIAIIYNIKHLTLNNDNILVNLHTIVKRYI